MFRGRVKHSQSDDAIPTHFTMKFASKDHIMSLWKLPRSNGGDKYCIVQPGTTKDGLQIWGPRLVSSIVWQESVNDRSEPGIYIKACGGNDGYAGYHNGVYYTYQGDVTMDNYTTLGKSPPEKNILRVFDVNRH